MKLQSPKRIMVEDYQDDDQAMAGTLGGTLNTFNEEVYLLTSGNVTISDNLNQELKTITVTVDSDGKPKTTVDFKNNLSGKLQGISVIRNFGVESVTSAPFIEFSETSSVISISKIIGLVADKEYQLVMHLIGN